MEYLGLKNHNNSISTKLDVSELNTNKLTEGKSQAFLNMSELQIDLDALKIVIKSPVIVDGVNNIWASDYSGTVSRNNGFFIYNKSTRRFDFSAIETHDKNNIILGFFWSDGTGTINTIRSYSLKKDNAWYNYNSLKNTSATFIGEDYIYIENLTFSKKPILYIGDNDTVWDANNLKIRPINGATDGYIFFNAKTKEFTLENISTLPLHKPKEMYVVSVLWRTGHYLENGNLKNRSFIKSIQKSNTASNDRIVTMGDSITQGLKDYNTPRGLYPNPWPNLLLNYYGKSVRNLAVSGKTISGTGSDDFNGQTNKVNFADFDVAIIAMGVNDFNVQANINDVKSGLRKGLDKIFKDNKNIKIAGILPHNLFRLPFTNPANTVYVDGLKYADKNGKTLNDFCDAIASVYDEYYIPYIDWRKAPLLTPRNHTKWTWDAIHPNEAGHELIARRVGEWLKINV